MADIPIITLNSELISLLGFAQKSRNVDKGFQAVRHGLSRKRVAFLLLDKSLGESSLKKTMSIARQHKTPVLMVDDESKQNSLVSIAGYKILGVHKGGLATGFIKKLKQEYQW